MWTLLLLLLLLVLLLRRSLLAGLHLVVAHSSDDRVDHLFEAGFPPSYRRPPFTTYTEKVGAHPEILRHFEQ